MSLHDLEINPGYSVDQLHTAYLEALRSIIDSVGRDEVVTESGIDESVIDAVLEEDGEVSLTLDDVVSIWALRTEELEADQLLTETRHDLMLAMSNAITNVDALSGDIEGDLSPNEIQAKLEGRLPMTLHEYTVFRQYFADRGTTG